MRIALIGYGKMGRAIEEIASGRNHHICLTISSSNKAAFTAENLRSCDAAIEFTNPHSAAENIRLCIDAGVPVVSGSTGWLEQWDEVAAYCKEKNGTLLYASNFSIGVNIFFEINKKLAAMMAAQPQYAVEIEEIHHTAKKDAPSGTAITLAEQIIRQSSTKKGWAKEKTDDPGLFPIMSKRIDPAPGTHHVRYKSAIDDIEIIHTAHSRTGFASGAVLAAEFIRGRKGIFSMKDVLNIE